jgi:hypothetical protein
LEPVDINQPRPVLAHESRSELPRHYGLFPLQIEGVITSMPRANTGWSADALHAATAQPDWRGKASNAVDELGFTANPATYRIGLEIAAP